MCTNPISLSVKTYKGNRRSISAPCGKCAECCKQYQNGWMLRLSEESANWEYAYFVTLTYRDGALPLRVLESEEYLPQIWHRLDLLPKNKNWYYHRSKNDGSSSYMFSNTAVAGVSVPSVSLSHIRNWIKVSRERFTREIGSRPSFKYFVCSEYGPNTLRPHYHGIFFCSFPYHEFIKFFVNSWSFGNVNHKEITNTRGLHGTFSNVSKYVAKYCCKPAAFENPYVLAGVVERPFRVMSKGIGKSFSERYSSQLSNPPVNRFATRKQLESGDHYFGLNPDFVAWSYDKLKVPVQTKKGVVLYSMPKYWRYALLPHRDTYVEIFNKKTKSFSVRSVSVYDSESRIALALLEYQRNLFAKDNREKFAKYKTLYPKISDCEAWQLVDVENSELLRQRRCSAFTSLSKYYFKGSLRYSF